MVKLLFEALHLFFHILEACLVAYVIVSWVPYGKRLKRMLTVFLEPILSFVRYLLRHSIYGSNVIDMSPLISLLILRYFQILLTTSFSWSTL